MPCAISSMPRGIFSTVWMVANFTSPPTRGTLPPSAKQYSASISPKCCFTDTRCRPSAFLARFGEEDDVAVERHIQPLEHQHRHQRGGDVVLVVDGAAAVDVAAIARRAEGGNVHFVGSTVTSRCAP